MRTLHGALTGVLALALGASGLTGVAYAAPATPPSAPYTALTVHFQGMGYIDGNFSYEGSRNSLQVVQQNANGYALSMMGSTEGYQHWHNIDVTPATGTRFVAGQTYATYQDWYPSPDHATLHLGGDGQSCSSGTPGSLKVLQADYDDATGQFTAFAATYAVPCSGNNASAVGEIRFQSTVGYQAADSWDYRSAYLEEPVGMAGSAKDFVVQVNGTEPTTFGTVALSGANPDAFAITADTCSGQTLSYGATCKLTVEARATALGDQAAIITLGESSMGQKISWLATLIGFDPRDTSMSGYFDFGYVAAYDTSAPKTVTLTGVGWQPITFGAGALSGPNANNFKITSDGCSGVTLGTGESCSITAVARPTVAAGVGAEFVLPDNSFAGSTRISLGVNGYTSDRGTYYTMSPYRIMDTRSGTGVRKGIVGPGGTLHLQVTGSGGVPTDASTVVLNVTVTGPTSSGFVTVYPTGVTRPNASSLNFVKGWTGANSVTVKVGSGGKVDFYNSTTASVHIIADVFGYYSVGHECCSGYMAGQYHPLSKPVRLVDTRTWKNGRIPGDRYINAAANWNSSTNYKVRAFAVNITATQPAASGFLTAWSGYAYGLPNTSTVNYTKNATVPNFAVVPTEPCDDCGSATGLPSIGVYTSAATHIIVDLVGFYDDGTLPDGLRFSPIVPTRIVDTRSGLGWPSRLGPAGTATVGVPASIADYDTWALAMNVTAVMPTANTFLTVWPSGMPRPNTSNLNPTVGRAVPNAVQTMLSEDNKFSVYNVAGYCNFLVDVVGTFYHYPPSTPAGWNSVRGAGVTAGTPAVPAPTVAPADRLKHL